VEGALTPETHFLNDLAVESLKLLELMLQFELQLGRPVSPDAAWEILTVGDAYSYYLRQAEGNAL
jgi:acyl carrier protein